MCPFVHRVLILFVVLFLLPQQLFVRYIIALFFSNVLPVCSFYRSSCLSVTSLHFFLATFCPFVPSTAAAVCPLHHCTFFSNALPVCSFYRSSCLSVTSLHFFLATFCPFVPSTAAAVCPLHHCTFFSNVLPVCSFYRSSCLSVTSLHFF